MLTRDKSITCKPIISGIPDSLPCALRTLPVILLFLLVFSADLCSQHTYPTGYFRPPVDFRMLLAGNFGELRENHFHSGIDIKTNGVEGAPVYAVADGYVSRIKVSGYGFGKVMYVTHANGYVSVYGHLSRFNDTIGNYVRKEQYRIENFEVELFPAAGAFPVKKGQIIAYSGNTGSSGGPHLHFEMRDAGSEKPINPLLFGYSVMDTFKPTISSIKIYPEDNRSGVNGSVMPVRFLVENAENGCRLAGNPAIRVSGNLSFAIQAYDRQNDADNKNGPYSIALYIDSAKVFQLRMETFSFDETRYVNSLIDYDEYMKDDARLERTKIDPGNRLDIYDEDRNKGVFRFDDDLYHRVRYEVKDVAGNTAVLSFRVKSETPSQMEVMEINSPPPKGSGWPVTTVKHFNYDTPNYYANGSVVLEAPKGAFYDSFEFRLDSAKQVAKTFSPVYRIHNKYTPVQDYITLSLKPVNLPENLRAKALVVKINNDGKGFTSAGGSWESGYVTTKTREFGDYSIAVDTIPPKIEPIQPELYIKLAGQKKVKFAITDELSGIASYKGTINGKWILMEYDPKNNLLIYIIDDRLPAGRSTFLLEVRDGKNNRAIFAATFIK